MAYIRRTRLSSAIWFALLLLCGGGCVVLDELVVLEDLGFSGADAPCARPGDPYYAPPCGEVYVMDPVFFGYHPTCWSPWPEARMGGPRCGVTVGIFPEAAGGARAGSPTLARPRSVLEEIEPPVPDPTDWDIVPAPDREPAEAQDRLDTPRQPQELTPLGPQEPTPLEPQEATPLEPQQPTPLEPQEATLLEPQDATPLRPDAIEVESSPFWEEKPPMDEHGVELPAETERTEEQPSDLSASRGDESARDRTPERCLASRTAVGIDVGRTGNPETDSREATLRAPLPEDVLGPVVGPISWKLSTTAEEEPAEDEEPMDRASGNEEASPFEESPESANQETATTQPEAPTPRSAAREAAMGASAGWASCSDADSAADSEEAQGENVSSSQEGPTGPVAAGPIWRPDRKPAQSPTCGIGRERGQSCSGVGQSDRVACDGTGFPACYLCPTDPVFFACQLPSASSFPDNASPAQ